MVKNKILSKKELLMNIKAKLKKYHTRQDYVKIA